jgi:hypothetical protein
VVKVEFQPLFAAPQAPEFLTSAAELLKLEAIRSFLPVAAKNRFISHWAPEIPKDLTCLQFDQVERTSLE